MRNALSTVLTRALFIILQVSAAGQRVAAQTVRMHS